MDPTLADIFKEMMGNKMTEKDSVLLDKLRAQIKAGEISLKKAKAIWSEKVTPI